MTLFDHALRRASRAALHIASIFPPASNDFELKFVDSILRRNSTVVDTDVGPASRGVDPQPSSAAGFRLTSWW